LVDHVSLCLLQSLQFLLIRLREHKLIMLSTLKCHSSRLYLMLCAPVTALWGPRAFSDQGILIILDVIDGLF
jgi:hypothetical protein